MDINLIQKYIVCINSFLFRTIQYKIIINNDKIDFKDTTNNNIIRFNNSINSCSMYFSMFLEDKLALMLMEIYVIIYEFDKIKNNDLKEFNNLVSNLQKKTFKYINSYEFIMELKTYIFEEIIIKNLKNNYEKIFNENIKIINELDDLNSSNNKLKMEKKLLITKINKLIKENETLKKENFKLKKNKNNKEEEKCEDIQPGCISNKK